VHLLADGQYLRIYRGFTKEPRHREWSYNEELAVDLIANLAREI
jgi:hypothetical protein